jgi:hypothetical protein
LQIPAFKASMPHLFTGDCVLMKRQRVGFGRLRGGAADCCEHRQAAGAAASLRPVAGGSGDLEMSKRCLTAAGRVPSTGRRLSGGPSGLDANPSLGPTGLGSHGKLSLEDYAVGALFIAAPLLPTVLVGRGDRRLLHRPRRQRADAQRRSVSPSARRPRSRLKQAKGP